jgi:uncharacterized membrane protein
METTRTPQVRASAFWNDDSRRLASIVGGVALGGYILTHPRVLKFIAGLGAAELLRRSFPLHLEVPSLRHGGESAGGSVKAQAAITVTADSEHVYQFWRDLNNAPKFMSGVEDVRSVSENVAVWRMRMLPGRSLSWVGETTEDIPGQQISWRIIGSDVLSGSSDARFAKGLLPGTTEVTVRQEMRLPVSGAHWISRTLLRRRLQESLRRLKQLIETGEVARIDGQPAGDRTFAGRIAHEYVKPVLIPR